MTEGVPACGSEGVDWRAAEPDSASTGDCPEWKRQLERAGMSQLTVPHDASQGLDVRSEAGSDCFNLTNGLLFVAGVLAVVVAGYGAVSATVIIYDENYCTYKGDIQHDA